MNVVTLWKLQPYSFWAFLAFTAFIAGSAALLGAYMMGTFGAVFAGIWSAAVYFCGFMSGAYEPDMEQVE